MLCPDIYSSCSFMIDSVAMEKANTMKKNFVSTFKHEKYHIKEMIGKTDNKTVDEDYSLKKHRFECELQQLTAILECVQQVIDEGQANQVVQNELARQYLGIYGIGPLTDAMKSYENATVRCQEELKSFRKRVQEDVVEPLIKYLAAFSETKKRIAELSRRRLDMDRYNERRLHIAKSKKSDKNRLEVADAKFQQAKANYDALAAELKNDLPILEQNVKEFVGPVFANFVRFQTDFLQSILLLYDTVTPQCSRVDSESVHRCRPNVTPSEISAMNMLASPQVVQAASLSSTELPVRGQELPFFSSTVSAAPSAPEIVPTAEQRCDASSKPLPTTPPSDVECVARCLYDYTASDAAELSFKKGDVLNILSRSGRWWNAERCGARGLVPSNFLKPLN